MRVHESGERIPLTIADYDRKEGTITIIFQVVGKTTMLLNQLEENDLIHDFVGPLGKPSHIEGLKKVCLIGGGVGSAIAYPVAKALHEQGSEVSVIAGFRTKIWLFWKKNLRLSASVFIWLAMMEVPVPRAW